MADPNWKNGFYYDALPPHTGMKLARPMDLFDMTLPALQELKLAPSTSSPSDTDLPVNSSHSFHKTSHSKSHPPPLNPPPHLLDLAKGLQPLAHIPTLVLGVQSDILFTVEQQREVADALRMAGNDSVSYYELGGVWGHDTFL
ncbi:hypothetical protein C0992_004626 [Termitomyces sp. T32_za158]|nr:hypothetical protein C0992_004626 [Termitomyces sp. T32_za158]